MPGDRAARAGSEGNDGDRPLEIRRKEGTGRPETFELRFEFSGQDGHELFRALCGVADSRVGPLGELLGVNLVPRGHAFKIQSEHPENIEFAAQFFRELGKQYRAGGAIPEEFDTRYLYRIMKRKGSAADLKLAEEPGFKKETIFTAFNGRPIAPRTLKQAEFADSILHNDITVCLGPAGTGKTFLSIAAACRLLNGAEQNRLIITRPAVEAGESLGFLPGDLAQKVDPYLRPLYDALYECLGVERVHDLINSRRIEIAPLAYMRGRTLNESIVILDEAQNCTLAQLKMFLTRLGRKSRMCLSGDITQIDLPAGKSGFMRAARILEKIDGVGCIEFGKEDIIRNPLVERIVEAFESA